MTRDGEIIKVIYDTLKEVRIPIFKFPGGLAVEFQIEDDEHAQALAEVIFLRIVPFLTERNRHPGGLRSSVPDQVSETREPSVCDPERSASGLEGECEGASVVAGREQTET